jgi:hypothetical protein
MRKIIMISLVALIAVSFMSSPTTATAPGDTVNPNGFPSGSHYNLNIIGKKAEFNCPAIEYDENNQPIYGNVVYVPENGKGIEILMQSGKGKKAEAIFELQVIDPCAGFDGNGAVIQLPKNEAGYRVYARALAKPTDNPDITVNPQLIAVEDESGNDLVYLGMVTETGFETPSETFIRTKGKSTAIPITGLFLWSGTVCYFSMPELYQSEMARCCIDSDFDGIYAECSEPTIDPVTLEPTCTDIGYDLVTAYCTEYTNDWVFNIGDFVNYLWSADNNGVKLLQVRFYPN